MLTSTKVKQFSSFLVFVVLFGVTLLLYAQSLSCGFVLDSPHVIVNNASIKQPLLYKDIFTKDFFTPYKELEQIKINYYRPVPLFFYILEYKLWRLNAGGYRFINIVIHSINAFLLYILFLKFLGSGNISLGQGNGGSTGFAPSSNLRNLSSITNAALSQNEHLAFLIAVFFCILPVHEWPINEVAGRSILLQMTFGLLSMIKFLRFIESKKKSAFILSLVYFVLTLLSREIAVFHVLILVLISWLYTHDLKRSIAVSFLFFLIAGGYLLLRLYFLPILSRSADSPGIMLWTDIFPWGWLVSWVEYFLRLGLPKITLLWLIRQEHYPLWFLLFGGGLGVFILYCFYKGSQLTKTILFLGLGWLVVAFLPLLSCGPQLRFLGPVLTDIHLYLAGAGFCIILGGWIYAFKITIQRILVVVLAAFFCVQISHNNFFWKDEQFLLEHVVELEGSGDTISRNQLLFKYHFDETKVLQKVKESSSPQQKVNWINSLGIDSVNKNLYSKGKEYFVWSNSIIPNAPAFLGEGIIYLKQKDYENCILYVQKSLSFDPESAFAYRVFGVGFYEQKMFKKAQQAFERAVFFDPDDLDSWLKLGVCYFWNNNVPLSQQSFEQALRLVKDKGYVLRYVAVEFYSHGVPLAAVLWLEQSIKEFPDKEMLILLGKMYSNLGDSKKAFEVWQRASRIAPYDPEIKQCLSRLEFGNFEIPGNRQEFKDYSPAQNQ